MSVLFCFWGYVSILISILIDDWGFFFGFLVFVFVQYYFDLFWRFVLCFLEM